jgi:hypothetical protein
MGPAAHLFGRLAFPLALTALAACGGQPVDHAADAGPPTALGSANRIRDVMNPQGSAHPSQLTAHVSFSGTTYLFVDSFDETHDGKSIGTVYMQDVPPSGSPPPPYSGVALYKPTYVPTNLVPQPGDVLDFNGTYTASASLGTATFPTGTFLIQIDSPILTPRFEYQLPPPAVIQVSDLEEGGATVNAAEYQKGQQWVGMLVQIQNITFPDGLAVASGRATIHITSDTSQNGPSISNELFDLVSWNNSFSSPPLAQNNSIKSVTGIVTWFYGYHVAPRSAADIVVE